jgi:hypothetical protein
MERVHRKPDPHLSEPDADAEPILTLTFALEPPWCLRIPGAAFLVSGGGEGWCGWTADAMGALADMPPLPDDVQPLYRIEISEAEVRGLSPLVAAEYAFPNWAGFPERQPDGGEPLQRRSSVLVTVFWPALETPFAEDHGEDVAHWLSRRFDDLLSLLNQYLVILAASNDEWHISSLSRIDIQRRVPWHIDLKPAPDDWTAVSGTIDAHVSLRDDLPAERPEQEILAAVELIHRYRRGEEPFFDWIELYQAAEHHLGSGRHSQAVIFSTTATEVLINTLFRVAWAVLDLDQERLPGVLDCGFKNQLTVHLPRLLDEELDLSDVETPPGRWYRDCYLLRNQIVHNGLKPSAPQAMDAKLATRKFAGWIGAALTPDPRIVGVKEFLQAPKRS